MSKAAYTPGPWTLGGHEWQQTRRFIYGTTPDGVNNPRIAIVEFGLNYGQELAAETAANAHLIAAAPELYEALEAQIRSFEMLAPRVGFTSRDIADGTAQARRALAKARGEAA